MGKGTIISHIGDGQYNLTVNYYRELYEKTIEALTEKISNLETQIYTVLEIGSEEYNLAKLELAAFKKRKQVLEDAFPEDQAIQAWCADLTENLSGEVKTIEVPGESGNIQIYPGYTSATWNETAGQLVPTVSQGSAQAFYNIAMLPGWQKWKPNFRYGTITSIDSGSEECNVTLEDIRSSQQGLSVNQSSNLSGVPIEYMTCNSAAFEVGDTVLIEFEGQDWNSPKVIGFKENPKSCYQTIMISCEQYCFVWNTIEDQYEEIVINDEPVTFPCLINDLQDWINKHGEQNSSLIFYTHSGDWDHNARRFRIGVWTPAFATSPCEIMLQNAWEDYIEHGNNDCFCNGNCERHCSGSGLYCTYTQDWVRTIDYGITTWNAYLTADIPYVKEFINLWEKFGCYIEKDVYVVMDGSISHDAAITEDIELTFNTFLGEESIESVRTFESAAGTVSAEQRSISGYSTLLAQKSDTLVCEVFLNHYSIAEIEDETVVNELDREFVVHAGFKILEGPDDFDLRMIDRSNALEQAVEDLINSTYNDTHSIDYKAMALTFYK